MSIETGQKMYSEISRRERAFVSLPVFRTEVCVSRVLSLSPCFLSVYSCVRNRLPEALQCPRLQNGAFWDLYMVTAEH